MLDYEFVILCTIYIILLCIIIITCIYKDVATLKCYDMDIENMRNCTNQEDMDQETFETPMVSQPHPPYLHFVEFTHLGQRFSNSDLPPSYENCILESEPPSYSVL